MIKQDCLFYNGNKCNILKKTYCRNVNCSFYKKREFNNKNSNKNNKNDTFCIKNKKNITNNNIEYKNYGNLEFTQDEIYKLKNKKIKIY